MPIKVVQSFDLESVSRILNLPAPASPNEPARLADLNSAVEGLSWKDNVRVSTQANLNLASPGATIDGAAMASGDRVLIRVQTAQPENGIYCVDTETEILTYDGFKSVNEIREGMMVLTLNMDTGFSEWQALLEIARFPGQKTKVLSIEGRAHSSLSTMDHRWPVIPRDKPIQIKKSFELNSHDSLIRAAACSNLPQISTYSDTLVELVAWFASEGHIKVLNSGKVGKNILITQSHKVNETYVQRIKLALSLEFGSESQQKLYGQLGKPVWRSTENGKNTVFRLNRTASERLLDLAPGRVPSYDFLRKLTKTQLELFVWVSIAADGHFHPTQKPGVFIQKDRNILDAVRFAATLLGYSTNELAASDGICKVLGISCQRTFNPKKNAKRCDSTIVTEVDFEGEVWCPRTQNTTWFARRRGTTYFTGNTWNGAAVAMTRSLDASTSEELENAIVSVDEGSSVGTTWRQTSVNFVLGTGNVVWGTFGTSAPPASDTVAGLVELATQAEVDAGTVPNMAVTPATLAGWAGRKILASAVIGDGSATQFDLTHNKGSRLVDIVVYRNAAPWDTVLTDQERPDVNTVRVRFAAAPAASAFVMMVLG